MAGYEVKQTAGTGVLVSPQQQFGFVILPLVKRKCVTANEHTSAMMQEMPEPMADDPLTADINNQTSISKFSVSQQEELLAHFNNQEVQALLDSVVILLKTLFDRRIELAKAKGGSPAFSLFSKLKRYSILKETQVLVGYFAKANTFFLAVNTRQITNTSCLTSMLYSKTQIRKFTEESEANIQAIAANPCLKQIASMFNGRGFPNNVTVQEFLALECWLVNGEFSLKLLRTVSAMCNGKGFPDSVTLQEFLTWECWQVNGEFSLELLRAVSSMMLSKGFPVKTEAEAFRAWECWQVKGEFNLKLLRAFSSMMSGRGFPIKTKVEAFLAWECWQMNGKFCLELLRVVSSLCHGKGLPDQTKVQDFLAWKCWKIHGEFSQELLHVVSSLCHGKGLPDQTKVEAFLAWECWKINGEFSLELLRAISSMCQGKGLPAQTKVKAFLAWECWKINGEFSLELLRAISSMMSRRGFPVEGKVQMFLRLACWQVKGEFSLERLRVVSSLYYGKGLPEPAKVEAFLSWECWQVSGELNLKLLRAVAARFHGKGLPDQEKVAAFIQWLPLGEKKNFLELFCRIFAGFGLPSVEKLTANEKIVRECLKQNDCSAEYEHENDSGTDDAPLESSQVKALALFFSGPGKWRITITEFEQYLTAHESFRNDRDAVHTALTSLLSILAIHGGTGIRFWIEQHRENPHCRAVLTKALTIPAPLALTKFALTELPESERQPYLEQCRYLKPAPTQEQWNALKPLRQQLGQRFGLTQHQRMMLEILWPQSEDNRTKYADRMDELFRTVPAVAQWNRLHRVFKPQKMQQFMNACLDYQAKSGTVPGLETQQRLLEGMLLTRHYLPEYGKIPDLCFSNRAPTDDERGVIIDGDYIMPGQERLWHFITAMLFELEQTEYQFKHQTLTIMPPDGEPLVLQTPDFALTNTSFVIKNWALEQLTAFFKALEFTAQWYEKPQDKRSLYGIRLETKLAQMKAKTKEARKAKPKRTTPLLPPSVIINIIQSNKTLKPAVWSSLEHYASNDQLTDRLCKAVSLLINDIDCVMPDLVKNAVAAKQEQIKAAETAIAQQRLQTNTNMPTPLGQIASTNTQEPLSTFDAAMEDLERFPVLGNTELEQLERYRGMMGTTQLMTVLNKINQHDVDKQTQNTWRTAFECRNKDPLGLNDIDLWEPDFNALATESEWDDNPDWFEDILQG